MNSRKDYIEFVDMLGKFKAMVSVDTVKIDEQSHQAIAQYINYFISELCRHFKRDNPKFDEAYFMKEYNRNKSSWLEYYQEQIAVSTGNLTETHIDKLDNYEKENLKLMDMEDGTRKL